MGAHQLVEGDALLSGEPAQACGGEMEPPRRGKRVYGMGHGGAEPAGLQARYGLVDGAPRPAADGDHFQPVEEGHRRQGAEQVGLTSCRFHPTASSASSPPDPAASGLRLLVCFLRAASGSAARSSCLAFSRSSTPLR